MSSLETPQLELDSIEETGQAVLDDILTSPCDFLVSNGARPLELTHADESDAREDTLTSKLVTGYGRTGEGVSLQVGVEEVIVRGSAKVPQMEIRGRARKDHYLSIAFSVEDSERNLVFRQPLKGSGPAMTRDPKVLPSVTIMEGVYTSSKETAKMAGEPSQITIEQGQEGYAEAYDEVLSNLGGNIEWWTANRAPHQSSEETVGVRVPELQGVRRTGRVRAAAAFAAHVVHIA
ncbi:hypothetical protein HY857_00310 [Candidatus Saccharibacteria bacterium]|nr:hypothetical protein [Candidatus Saccharibacteria bacterium]